VIPYPSIETVFRRDPETKRLDFNQIRIPEAELVNEWRLTEKVDGTNIRLIFTEDGLDVRGRTNAAKFKPSHLEYLNGLVDVEDAKDLLRHPTRPDWNVTIYGELYGPGIQKGGDYRPDVGFRAFDIMYGGSIWGSPHDLAYVAYSLGIRLVPEIPGGVSLLRLPKTKQEMDALVGCSQVAAIEHDNVIRPEGFVARPPLPLLNARGDRVMFKLTYRDLPEARELVA
jgi:hypothetical protein